MDASKCWTISGRALRKIGGFDRLMKTAMAILTVALGAGVWAQQGPKISVRVNEVTLFATVHDPDGRVVKNLTRDDFVVREEGVEQKIDFFSRESDLPLTIGLLVDTSRSQTGVLETERRASYKFLEQVMRQGKDQAFVVHFDTQVETLQAPTSSRDDLELALSRLSIPERDATLVYSAIKESSSDWMSQFMGRKAFILLSDGVAFREPTSITTAIEYAQRADTIIYPIRYADPVPLTRPVIGTILAIASEHGKQGLHRMARETGGDYNEVTKNQSIEDIYAQIEEELRNQYDIGYTPARAESDGKYHKIKLTTKNRRLVVTTRAGYYAR
jgi:VWFA-related protein